MKRTIIIFIGIIVLLLIGAYFNFFSKNSSVNEFDPSIYFDNESVSQEQINNTLSQEEIEELDQIYNSQIKQ
jgi:uncharacterized protein YxeA